MTQTNWKFLSPLESGSPVNSPIVIGDTLKESLYKLQGQSNYASAHSSASYLVEYATTQHLTGTYNNGSSGVGATLTNNSLQSPLSIDSNIVSLNERILVKNQSDEKHNGVYVVTNVGDYSTNWILTRSSDYDNHEPGLLRSDNVVIVKNGTWNARSIFVQVSIGTGTLRSILIGSEPVSYIQIANSFEVGEQALVRIPGTFATANGRFSNTGDAQEGKYILRTRTVNENFTELFLDGEGGSRRLILPDNSTWMFEAKISAHQTSSGDGHAAFIIRGSIYRDNGANTTMIQGTVSKEIISRPNLNWDVNIIQDSVNGSLKLETKGEFGKIIRWVAVINTTEITN